MQDSRQDIPYYILQLVAGHLIGRKTLVSMIWDCEKTLLSQFMFLK